ncbi:hypothetical protein EDEG_00060 [Edhazardia aedis USNM 41457]|uniref:Uncharacterized protein n=1 Tax=Edhazardia aedis (strain USNM 41457) TaxID=1003232 RepID=J9DRL3_EDHAE|nr:hypothetical protein EDEG_00060 [Edhazardia aedis USNM 41457]|eukprot:EJW05205.1 hypothetical protein EDEG_00060 [Edhazardia aedis USNM 41457]
MHLEFKFFTKKAFKILLYFLNHFKYIDDSFFNNYIPLCVNLRIYKQFQKKSSTVIFFKIYLCLYIKTNFLVLFLKKLKKFMNSASLKKIKKNKKYSAKNNKKLMISDHRYSKNHIFFPY